MPFPVTSPVILSGLNILVAGACDRTASFLCKLLLANQFQAAAVETDQSEVSTLQRSNYDALLLHLRESDDASVCKVSDIVEAFPDLPVLVLMDVSDYLRRVALLKAGCDDVLSTPYATEELLARLTSLLRRYRVWRRIDGCSVLSYSDLVVDTNTREVSRAGRLIKLSVKEYDLLLCLLRNQQQVIARQRLLHLVWGDSWVGDDNLLDVYIRYLRKKVESPGLDPLIHTVRGVGFVLR